MIEADTILLAISEAVPDAVLQQEAAFGMLNIHVSREKVWDVLKALRDHDTLQFNFLTTLCCTHYPERAAQGSEYTMMYQLHSWTNNVRVRIKTELPLGDHSIPTVSNLWPTANWMERQEYDFFGVNFTGHPDLRRILNVDDLDVFPMRKEFALEDGTRTDKDDRFFGRTGNYQQRFD
jgi:NADH-quinone oxidoreductase subunit C